MVDYIYVLEHEEDESYGLLGFYPSVERAFDVAEEQEEGENPVPLGTLTVIEVPFDALVSWRPRVDGHVVVSPEGHASLCRSWLVSDGRPPDEDDAEDDDVEAEPIVDDDDIAIDEGALFESLSFD